MCSGALYHMLRTLYLVPYVGLCNFFCVCSQARLDALCLSVCISMCLCLHVFGSVQTSWNPRSDLGRVEGMHCLSLSLGSYGHAILMIAHTILSPNHTVIETAVKFGDLLTHNHCLI